MQRSFTAFSCVLFLVPLDLNEERRCGRRSMLQLVVSPLQAVIELMHGSLEQGNQEMTEAHKFPWCDLHQLQCQR